MTFKIEDHVIYAPDGNVITDAFINDISVSGKSVQLSFSDNSTAWVLTHNVIPYTSQKMDELKIFLREFF